MTRKTDTGEILLYQTADGLAKIEVTLVNDTVWLTLDQMATLFQRNKSTISRHIKDAFESGELNADSVVAFFATTAAELIYDRADAEKDFMGLMTWTGPLPRRSDAEVAKNYLNADEVDTLNRIVSLYLDYAELQAKEHKPMYMSDWIQRLDDFLKLSGKALLQHAGTISAKLAKEKADAEYDKFEVRTRNELSPVELHFIENFERERLKLTSGQDTPEAQ